MSLCVLSLSLSLSAFFSGRQLPRRPLLLLRPPVPLVLILLLVRAQLDFSGDLALQDTREARPHASAIGTVFAVQARRTA